MATPQTRRPEASLGNSEFRIAERMRQDIENEERLGIGVPVFRPKRGSQKRGRRPGPTRCVIQLRVRECGKVASYYSLTAYLSPYEAMRRLQEAFQDGRREKEGGK